MDKKERSKLASRLYRKIYPDRARKSVREYTKRNWEKRKEYQKKWARNNRDKVNKYRKKSYWEWKKGIILTENKKYRNKSYFNGLRDVRLKFDNFTCQMCGSKNRLHIHHLKYCDNILLEDLITLCVSCHMKYHNKLLREQYGINSFYR